MLLKDRAGPLSDMQRQLLEEAEKSCGRLSALLDELSDLSQLESGTAPYNRSTGRPEGHPDRCHRGPCPSCPTGRVAVDLSRRQGVAVHGDAVRLQIRVRLASCTRSDARS